MVHDISAKLPRPPHASPGPAQPLLSGARAHLGPYALDLARALLPALLAALAAGMMGWLGATAVAAFHLAPGTAPLVVAFGLARWIFVAGIARELLRHALQLERRRWRNRPTPA